MKFPVGHAAPAIALAATFAFGLIAFGGGGAAAETANPWMLPSIALRAAGGDGLHHEGDCRQPACQGAPGGPARKHMLPSPLSLCADFTPPYQDRANGGSKPRPAGQQSL